MSVGLNREGSELDLRFCEGTYEPSHEKERPGTNRSAGAQGSADHVVQRELQGVRDKEKGGGWVGRGKISRAREDPGRCKRPKRKETGCKKSMLGSGQGKKGTTR